MYVYRLASRTRGKWTVEIISDGSLMLTSHYRNRVNCSHRIYPEDRLVDVGPNFPGYLHRFVQEAWEVYSNAVKG